MAVAGSSLEFRRYQVQSAPILDVLTYLKRFGTRLKRVFLCDEENVRFLGDMTTAGARLAWGVSSKQKRQRLVGCQGLAPAPANASDYEIEPSSSFIWMFVGSSSDQEMRLHRTPAMDSLLFAGNVAITCPDVAEIGSPDAADMMIAKALRQLVEQYTGVDVIAMSGDRKGPMADVLSQFGTTQGASRMVRRMHSNAAVFCVADEGLRERFGWRKHQILMTPDLEDMVNLCESVHGGMEFWPTSHPNEGLKPAMQALWRVKRVEYAIEMTHSFKRWRKQFGRELQSVRLLVSPN